MKKKVPLWGGTFWQGFKKLGLFNFFKIYVGYFTIVVVTFIG
jgi:hypothetical protein